VIATADGVSLRVPPHDLDAEASMLGACLLDSSFVGAVLGIVADDDPYRAAHGHVLKALRALHTRGEPIDGVCVVAEMRRAGTLDAVGGKPFLESLVKSAETSANAETYAGIVRDRAIARATIRFAMEIQQTAYDGEVRGADLLDEAEARLFALRRARADAAVVGGDVIAKALRDEWEDTTKAPPALSTGFFGLDSMTSGGFRAGQLVTIGAGTGGGKTTLALNLARAAIRADRNVLVFSVEMSREELVRNLLAAEASVDTSSLHDARRLTDVNRDALYKAQSRLDLGRLRVFDSADVTPTTIRSVARREAMRRDVGIVIVDYIQLVGSDDVGAKSRNTSREREVAAVSRALKLLAREIRTPVVALSQLNREHEKRDDHRPRLSDFRESAAVVHDADLVLGLLVPAQHKPNDPSLCGVLDVHILKQRNGPLGRVQLAYRPENAWLGDLAPMPAKTGGCR